MAGSSSEGRTSRTKSVGTKITEEESARLGQTGCSPAPRGRCVGHPEDSINNGTTFPANVGGYWNQTTTTNAYNATILLHELGHALKDLKWANDQIVDDPTPELSDQNNNTISSACGKYFKN